MYMHANIGCSTDSMICPGIFRMLYTEDTVPRCFSSDNTAWISSVLVSSALMQFAVPILTPWILRLPTIINWLKEG